MSAGEWGIWCLVTESWVYDVNPAEPVRYASKREAQQDLKDWCVRQNLKHYEARRLDDAVRDHREA